MQEMLEQVRLEMQELQSSRDTWQRRAIASDISLGSLNSQVSGLQLCLHQSDLEMLLGVKCFFVLCLQSSET
jgi:hypothetical protein